MNETFVDGSPIFLAPFSENVFKSKYLDKKRLVIKRQNDGYFQKLVSLTHIDELVTSIRIPATNFNLSMGDLPLPLNSYCIGSSFVDKLKALALHQEGATIILRSVEQWSAALNRLRIIAEDFFRCECQINTYITPPNQKSTPPHWDTHDLVVMQISGRKRWRLYDGQRSLPLADERFKIGKDYVSTECEEITLDAGDTLYLPRGVIHEPVAETYSIHISIGVHVPRWYDVLSVAIRILADKEGSQLRTSVLSTTEKPNTLESLNASLVFDQDLQEQALDVLFQQFEKTRSVDIQETLLSIAEELNQQSKDLNATITKQ